jgi:hypothetical protein
MEQIENDATQEATPEELELAQEIAKEIAGNPEKLQSLLEESE